MKLREILLGALSFFDTTLDINTIWVSKVWHSSYAPGSRWVSAGEKRVTVLVLFSQIPTWIASELDLSVFAWWTLVCTVSACTCQTDTDEAATLDPSKTLLPTRRNTFSPASISVLMCNVLIMSIFLFSPQRFPAKPSGKTCWHWRKSCWLSVSRLIFTTGDYFILHHFNTSWWNHTFPCLLRCCPSSPADTPAPTYCDITTPQ